MSKKYRVINVSIKDPGQTAQPDFAVSKHNLGTVLNAYGIREAGNMEAAKNVI